MAPERRSIPALLSTLVAFLFLLLASPVLAQPSSSSSSQKPAQTQSSPASAPSIYNGSSKYVYQGCYNETVGIEGTTGARAISDGTHLIREGSMTAPDCLSFCSSNGTTYKYAGLEFSRECWCGNSMSALATKEADSVCNTPCDGDRNMACGGALKLTVYMVHSAASVRVVSSAVLVMMAGAAFFSLA